MKDVVKAASKSYHAAPKWLYGIVACSNHVDREAVILFEKPGKQFAYCAECARREKGAGLWAW